MSLCCVFALLWRIQITKEGAHISSRRWSYAFQQISIASSDDYTKTALEWIAKHDLLMLKMKKNVKLVHFDFWFSFLSNFSQYSAEWCKLMASSRGKKCRDWSTRYPASPEDDSTFVVDYPLSKKIFDGQFSAHLKLFLPTVIAILRGRRLPSTTHDQLVACLQKLSVR